MLPFPLRIVPVKFTMMSDSLYFSEQANFSSLTISVGGNDTISFLVIISSLGTLLEILMILFDVVRLGSAMEDDSLYFYPQKYF